MHMCVRDMYLYACMHVCRSVCEILLGLPCICNKTVVRPAMMYGAMGSEESTREEVRCGRNEDVNGWMSGVTKLDRIRNEKIRGTTKVGEISKKFG